MGGQADAETRPQLGEPEHGLAPGGADLREDERHVGAVVLDAREEDVGEDFEGEEGDGPERRGCAGVVDELDGRQAGHLGSAGHGLAGATPCAGLF